MSGIVNFNAQVAPLEHVEKIVRQEQEHGAIKQQALMQKAAERLSKDNEQVQKSAKSRKDRKVGKRNHDDENARNRWAGNADDAPEAEDESLEAGACSGIWSGNIVNLKV